MQTRGYTKAFTDLGTIVRGFNHADTTFRNNMDTDYSQAGAILNDDALERNLLYKLAGNYNSAKTQADSVAASFKTTADYCFTTIFSSECFLAFANAAQLLTALNDAMQDDGQTINGNTINTYNEEGDTGALLSDWNVAGTPSFTLTDNGKVYVKIIASGAGTMVLGSRISGQFTSGALIFSGSIGAASGTCSLSAQNSSGFTGTVTVNRTASSSAIIIHLLPEPDPDNEGWGADIWTVITTGQQARTATWTLECTSAETSTVASRWSVHYVDEDGKTYTPSAITADTSSSLTAHGAFFTLSDPDTVTVSSLDFNPYALTHAIGHSGSITSYHATGGSFAQEFSVSVSTTINSIYIYLSYSASATTSASSYVQFAFYTAGGTGAPNAQQFLTDTRLASTVSASGWYLISISTTQYLEPNVQYWIRTSGSNVDIIWGRGDDFGVGQSWYHNGMEWTILGATSDFHFQVTKESGRTSPLSGWVINNRSSAALGRTSITATAGYYGIYGQAWARCYTSGGTAHVALFQTQAGAIGGSASLCVASGSGTVSGTVYLYAQNAFSISGQVTTSGFLDVTDGSIFLYLELPFVVGDKFYFKIESSDDAVFQTFLRDNYSKTLPSVTDGTETISDTLAS